MSRPGSAAAGAPGAGHPELDPPVTVVLASASPRRLDLLRRIGIEPEVHPAHVDETPEPGESPDSLVRRLALAKCVAVADAVDGDRVVVAADTVVLHRGVVLNKPVDDDEARSMLRSLAASEHQVLTGLAVARGARRAVALESTDVRFRPLSDDEISVYVASGEPADKAGAYGIQGAAGAFVTSISGSDTNVIGLPLAALVGALAEVGVVVRPRPLRVR